MAGQGRAPHEPARDEEFLRLWTSQQRQVHAYVTTLVANPADVDEVLQETSIVLWQKFSEFHPPAESAADRGQAFARWACGVAHYEMFRLLRATKRKMLPLEDEVLERIAAEQLAMLPRLDARHAALQECLKRLRAADRELVEQCYQRDRTSREVAEELGRPVDSVYQSLSRIRRALHDCIDRTLAAEDRP